MTKSPSGSTMLTIGAIVIAFVGQVGAGDDPEELPEGCKLDAISAAVPTAHGIHPQAGDYDKHFKAAAYYVLAWSIRQREDPPLTTEQCLVHKRYRGQKGHECWVLAELYRHPPQKDWKLSRTYRTRRGAGDRFTCQKIPYAKRYDARPKAGEVDYAIDEFASILPGGDSRKALRGAVCTKIWKEVFREKPTRSSWP